MDFDSTFAAINPFGGVDYAPHNKGVTPVFFVEPILDPAATEKEGRTIYREKERVRIYIAGDPLSAATHPVDATIIARFPEQYNSWKSKKSGSHIVGMPLSRWPMATPGLIKELEFLNIYSVEDLAAVSDGNIQNVTDGRAIREKAVAWLASAKDGAAAMRYAAENARLREEMAELRKAILSMGGTVGEPKPPRVQRAAKPRVKKNARKSAWTQERRKAASKAAKARGGFGGRPKDPLDINATAAAPMEA
jgi:hypothetical protein